MNEPMAWPQVEEAVRGIFARRYFANNGPLVRQLDAGLAAALGVGHAVCVTNGTAALTLLAMAVARSGEVVVPPDAPRSTIDALRWAGLVPTSAVSASAVAVVDVLGEGKVAASEPSLPLLVDARAVSPRRVAGLGAAFSLESMNAGEGGFITTDDAALAGRLRTMRNFHPSETFADVDVRTNAKMSEMQAALGLIALENLRAAR